MACNSGESVILLRPIAWYQTYYYDSAHQICNCHASDICDMKQRCLLEVHFTAVVVIAICWNSIDSDFNPKRTRNTWMHAQHCSYTCWPMMYCIWHNLMKIMYLINNIRKFNQTFKNSAQGARASATVVKTYFVQAIPVTVPKGLNLCLKWYNVCNIIPTVHVLTGVGVFLIHNSDWNSIRLSVQIWSKWPWLITFPVLVTYWWHFSDWIDKSFP